MAKLKAEFLYQWYKTHRIPLRSWFVANITRINAIGSIFPKFTNYLLSNSFIKGIAQKTLGFANERQLPLLYKTTLKKWHKKSWKINGNKRKVYLLADEFTNFNDTQIGIKAIEILKKLGYEVLIPDVFESGRTYISKGLIKKAKQIANDNVYRLSRCISQDTPLIGIEPSAILSFRDEYPDLVDYEHKNNAIQLGKYCLLFEEFFIREVEAGNITKTQFKSEVKDIKLHGHCQQKAVASTNQTKAMLSFPSGHSVTEIPSGCCGMAGSFGYEREHYDLSMKIGELVLFPEVRKTPMGVAIAAPGTSCRNQIKDGTDRKAQHPIEILWDAINWD
jgi:Fe-S oxidoreductase